MSKLGEDEDDSTWEVNCSTGILLSLVSEELEEEDGLEATEEPPEAWGLVCGVFFILGWFWLLTLSSAPSPVDPVDPPDWIFVSKFWGPWIKLEWKLDSRIRTYGYRNK